MSAFVCEDHHYTCVIASVIDADFYGDKPDYKQVNHDLNVLLTENVLAVNTRYNRDDTHPALLFTQGDLHYKASPVAALKLLSCLSYQMDESPDIQHSDAFSLIEDMKKQVLGSCVSKLRDISTLRTEDLSDLTQKIEVFYREALIKEGLFKNKGVGQHTVEHFLNGLSDYIDSRKDINSEFMEKTDLSEKLDKDTFHLYLAGMLSDLDTMLRQTIPAWTESDDYSVFEREVSNAYSAISTYLDAPWEADPIFSPSLSMS